MIIVGFIFLFWFSKNDNDKYHRQRPFWSRKYYLTNIRYNAVTVYKDWPTLVARDYTFARSAEKRLRVRLHVTSIHICGQCDALLFTMTLILWFYDFTTSGTTVIVINIVHVYTTFSQHKFTLHVYCTVSLRVIYTEQ